MLSVNSSRVQKEKLGLKQIINKKTYYEMLENDLQPYLQEKQFKSPNCFISYAWGDPEQERNERANAIVVLEKLRLHSAELQIGLSKAQTQQISVGLQTNLKSFETEQHSWLAYAGHSLEKLQSKTHET